MKVEDTKDLDNNYVGHMIEYMVQNVNLEHLDALDELTDKHVEKEFDLPENYDLEKSIEHELDLISGGWKPDLYIVVKIFGKKKNYDYGLIHKVIYPVEVKSGSAHLERNQGDTMRKYSQNHLGNSIRYGVARDKLPEKFHTNARFIK